MDSKDCSLEIAACLAKGGIKLGDSLLVHSSFKSLGSVPGGIETVINGLLLAIGNDGTLLMPALSWSLRPPEIFHLLHTPTNTGAIPEFFRKMEGVERSFHPTHSVCAYGKKAKEFLSDHWQDSTPCGKNSPFRKLLEEGGKILMLGCGLKPNTSMHALEEYVCPPYLFGETFLFKMADKTGKIREKEYKTHGFKLFGYEQRYDRIAELDSDSFLKQGRVLDAAAFFIDAKGLKEAVLSKLEKDPFFFVDANSNAITGSQEYNIPSY